MSDYYYENNILPPDIHFRKPHWMKKVKTEEEAKSEDDKVITSPDTSDSNKKEEKEPTYPFKLNDRSIMLNEDERAYLRPKERRRSLSKKRSMSTSFSFCSDGLNGTGMSSGSQQPSNLLQANNQINTNTRSSGNMLSPTLYIPQTNEIRGKLNKSGSLKSS